MKSLKSLFVSLLLLIVLGAVAAGAGAWYWMQNPVSIDADRVVFTVVPRNGFRASVQRMSQAGVHVKEGAFVALARISGYDTGIHAGAEEALRGETPVSLLERMARGEMVQPRL